MKILVTGGTGFIGRPLVAALVERGDDVVVVTRDEVRGRTLWKSSPTLIKGDPCYAGDWQDSVAGCDAVINLAGENLAGTRWNARYRQIIHDSRVDSTRFVVEAMRSQPTSSRPEVLVNASGLDYYGFAEGMFDEDEIDESAPGGESFLSYLCWDWEEETKPCAELGVRKVLMRTGLVLGADGGAFPKLIKPFRLGFGGRLGKGKQWMSWVHRKDAVRAYVHAIDSQIEGPVNLVAPGNLRSEDFAKVMASSLNRKAWFPVPGFLVSARAGQLGEYILRGRRGIPSALTESGFEFHFPELRSALTDLCR